MPSNTMKLLLCFLLLSLNGHAQLPSTGSRFNASVFFGKKALTLEEIRLAAIEALKAKGVEPLANANCTINITLDPSQTCTVIFVRSESGRLKAVQQVVFDKKGRAFRVEDGPQKEGAR